MTDDTDKPNDDPIIVSVPGVVCVSATGVAGSTLRGVIRLGPSAGWMVPTGITQWERELSFMARPEMTAQVARALRATMPYEQIAPKRFAAAASAVAVSPLLALTGDLVDDARKAGARVHTLGVDRVSSEFYYFAEGGAGRAVHVQGDLVEMLAPSLGASTTNDEIADLLEGLIDRLLAKLSEGAVTEIDVELADALPRLSRNGTGLVGTDLETFDTNARRLAARSSRFEAAARRIGDELARAEHLGELTAPVSLYGRATKEARAPLDVLVGGEQLRLPAQHRWTVRGPPREDAASPRSGAHRTDDSPPASVGFQSVSEVEVTPSAATPSPATPPAAYVAGAVSLPTAEPFPTPMAPDAPSAPLTVPAAVTVAPDAPSAQLISPTTVIILEPAPPEPIEAPKRSSTPPPRPRVATAPAHTELSASPSSVPTPASDAATLSSDASRGMQSPPQPTPGPGPKGAEGPRPIPAAIVALLAVVLTIAYFGWHWWQVHHMGAR